MKKSTLAIVAGFVALGPLATDMYLPALPAIGMALGAGTADVQMTLSIYMLGFALGQIIYGPLSDRFGRKPLLLMGLGLFALSSVFIIFTTSIDTLIAARLLQALGGCAGPVLGRAMVRDLCKPQDAGRALSNIATIMALAPALAPFLGSYLTVWFSWHANFVFLLVYALLLVFLLLRFVPESLQKVSPDATNIKRILTNYIYLSRHKLWLWNTLVCSAAYAGLFAYLSGSSFVLIETLAVSEQVYALTFTFIVVGYIFGTQTAAKLSHSTPRFRLILAGSIVMFVSGGISLWLASTGPPDVASVIVPQFFFMLGVGVVMPLAMAGALIPFPNMAGAASALLGVVQMSLAALFGSAVGHWYDGSALVMAVGLTVAGTLALIGSLKLPR